MAKWVLLFCFLIAVSFFVPEKAFAHLAGMPPYFKINGKYSNFYHVQSTSVDEIVLAQDAGPENYLMNQPIDFDMDLTQLPFPPDIVKKAKFFWDFGDGTTGTGTKNIHTYTKMGTYLVKITTDQGVGDFETVFINVLPNKDYQLPQAVMTINGRRIDEVASAPLEIKPSDTLSFDARGSTATSSSIVSYLWDFGDTVTNKEQTVTHNFNAKYHLVFPLLRVKDANGFIADTFTTVSIDEKNAGAPSPPPTTTQIEKKPNQPSVLPWIVGVGVTFLVLILLAVAAGGKKKSN